MQVTVTDGNLEGALRALRRLVTKDGLLQALRAKETYRKPSVRRRDKHRKAIRRLRKSQARQENLRSRSNYDYIKKQDQANRQFVIRRAIDPIRRNQ